MTTSDLSVFAFAQFEQRLLAATSVGILQSVDSGRTWTPLGKFPAVAQSLAVLPRGSASVLLLAGGEAGVMRSDDTEQSWVVTLTGSTVTATAGSLNADGEALVLAGTETDGITRSIDGGQTWVGASAGLLDLEVLCLALSPTFADDNTGFVGTASGLYRTRNGGQAWRWLEVPVTEAAVQSLALAPSFGLCGIVLAGTEADGLFRSDDEGRTWQVIDELSDQSITALAWSTGPDPTVFAATDEGIARSGDAGLTWARVSDLESVVALSVLRNDTASTETVVAGLVTGGIMRSNDGAQSWQTASIMSTVEAAE